MIVLPNFLYFALIYSCITPQVGRHCHRPRSSLCVVVASGCVGL